MIVFLAPSLLSIIVIGVIILRNSFSTSTDL